MLLVSLKLNNIRSYKEQKLEFPKGIVLLSGDIGTGKSSILLSIEFALFGLLRSELSGAALLRHGATEGSVELSFKLYGKDYTIKRTLKRTKTSVEQGAGYIIVDGVKKDATPVELKSDVISLLGYPSEFLTKSKNFVYRYTVYTPQEQMKQILGDDSESRVALLRKVFGIDKYERIKQNASSYSRLLRERRRGQELLLQDEEEKKQQLKQIDESLLESVKELQTIQPILEQERKELLIAKEQLSGLEEQKQQSDELMKQRELIGTQITHKKQEQERIIAEIDIISEQLKEGLPSVPNIEEVNKRLTETQLKLVQHENSILDFNRKIAEQETLQKNSEQVINKITGLASCPMCLQDVSHEHKDHIKSEQEQKVKEVLKKLGDYSSSLVELQNQKKLMQEEVEKLRKEEQESAVMNVKVKHHEERKSKKVELELQQERHKTDLLDITKKQLQISQHLVAFRDITEKYDEQKKKVDGIMRKERQLTIQHTMLTQKQQSFGQQKEMIQKELEKKKEIRAVLESINKQHHWMADMFIPLMDVMEKHVMAKIHHEFDSLFQQWFSMLVEDELMTARLDELFTPVIQQNGYDVSVQHLSGGERTAVALAYRLALNKTINSLISTINTKDLLILDEPTDGFSAQQLDRIRDVLEQLNLKQLVIVSHEQKIESFADSVIRIGKEGHVSGVV